jgi:hypothetical protein
MTRSQRPGAARRAALGCHSPQRAGAFRKPSGTGGRSPLRAGVCRMPSGARGRSQRRARACLRLWRKSRGGRRRSKGEAGGGGARSWPTAAAAKTAWRAETPQGARGPLAAAGRGLHAIGGGGDVVQGGDAASAAGGGGGARPAGGGGGGDGLAGGDATKLWQAPSGRSPRRAGARLRSPPPAGQSDVTSQEDRIAKRRKGGLHPYVSREVEAKRLVHVVIVQSDNHLQSHRYIAWKSSVKNQSLLKVYPFHQDAETAFSSQSLFQSSITFKEGPISWK